MEFTTSFELQSQATRLRYTAYNGGLRVTNGIVTLSDVLFQGTYITPLGFRMPITILQLSAADFHFELFPVHSPLLGESLLFSFPPLTDMLKFSG